MNSRLNNIFSETDCLTPEVLTAYAENRLSNEDRYLVEKHLTDCELCSDAMEGMSLVKDKTEIKSIFIGIQKEIDKRILKKDRKILHVNFRMRLAAAAILITIVGVTFLFRYYLGEQKKNMMAERTLKESKLSKQEKESASDEINGGQGGEEQSKFSVAGKGKETASDLIVADGEKADQDVSVKDVPFMLPKAYTMADQQQESEKETYSWFSNDATTATEKVNEVAERKLEKTDENTRGGLTGDYKNSENNQSMADSISVSDNLTETKAVSQAGAYRTEVTTEEDKSKFKANKKGFLKNENNSNVNQTATTNSITAPTNAVVTVGANGNSALADQRYSTAVQKYQNSDYSGSKDMLESYIADHPSDYNALYYCGVSYYFLNNYSDAITYLDKVVKNKNGIYYETARWYLALSHINLNETKKAEKILNEIVKDSSSFKIQAGEKLKEINK